MEATTHNPLLRPRAAARYLGVSPPTVYRWEASGLLPPRIVLGPGVSGWRLADLNALLESRPRGGDARRGPRAGSPAPEAA